MLAGCGGGGVQSSVLADTIPPQAGQVRDGAGEDVDGQTDTDKITANWVGFSDDSGSIDFYEWAIGTSAGGTDVQDWQNVEGATTATRAGLTLPVGLTLYCSVRATDAAGNTSAVATSDGVTIEAGTGGGAGGGSSNPPPPGPGTYASSISRHGVTWTFAEAELVGQFANGDWWVKGPVQITSISPPCQVVAGRTINGSMVNPVTLANAQHGYDSTLYAPYADQKYQSSLNVAIGVSPTSPLQLTAGKSLISAISWTDSNPPASGSMSQLRTAAVLTVLADAAPSGAFRPCYTGNDKTIRFLEADLDYTALAAVAAAPGMPSVATTTAGFERVWLDHCSGWGSRFLHPVENMPDYSRDFTALYGTGALMANLDLPQSQKRDLVVRLVQIGIDFYGNLLAGGTWPGAGGQCSGRKFPILFAGKLLDDAAMLAIGTSHPSGYYGPGNPNNRSIFGEDCQTFYVLQTSPGVWNWGFGGYNATHGNLPEWGMYHTDYPQYDTPDWSEATPYRLCCTANCWVGQTLAARIMGLRTAWNHPAYFDYQDRYMNYPLAQAWWRNWEPWQGAMWDLHRPNF